MAPRAKTKRDAAPPVADTSLLVSGIEVKPHDHRWLLPDRIQADALCICEGDPHAGKSTYLSALAAAVTAGLPLLGAPRTIPRRVLWASSEEDAGSDIVPRLVAAGGDASGILFPREENGHGPAYKFSLAGSLKQLDALVCEKQIGLIVADPLWSFLPVGAGSRDETEIRAVLDPLAALARRRCCCVMLVRQLRKDRTGPRITHGLGHTTFGAAAASIILVEWPDQLKPLRFLRPIKVRGARRPATVEWRVVVEGKLPVLRVLRELRADEDVDAAETADHGERGVRADARTLLMSAVASGWTKASDILEQARAAGIGERTLRKVKQEMDIPSRIVADADPRYFEWGPPESDGDGTPGRTVQPSIAAVENGKNGEKNGKSKTARAKTAHSAGVPQVGAVQSSPQGETGAPAADGK